MKGLSSAWPSEVDVQSGKARSRSSILAIGAGAALVMGLIPLELLWKGGLLDRMSSSRTASMSRSAKRATNCEAKA